MGNYCSSESPLSNRKLDTSLNGQHMFGRISLPLLIDGKALSFSTIPIKPVTEGTGSQVPLNPHSTLSVGL